MLLLILSSIEAFLVHFTDTISQMFRFQPCVLAYYKVQHKLPDLLLTEVCVSLISVLKIDQSFFDHVEWSKQEYKNTDCCLTFLHQSERRQPPSSLNSSPREEVYCLYNLQLQDHCHASRELLPKRCHLSAQQDEEGYNPTYQQH